MIHSILTISQHSHGSKVHIHESGNREISITSGMLKWLTLHLSWRMCNVYIILAFSPSAISLTTPTQILKINIPNINKTLIPQDEIYSHLHFATSNASRSPSTTWPRLISQEKWYARSVARRKPPSQTHFSSSCRSGPRCRHREKIQYPVENG